MIHKLKFLFILLVATIGVAAIFGGQPAYAKGEKWELVDKTSIKISGGLFSGPTTWSANGRQGTTSNPTSITLKPRDGNGQTSPSIWIATTAFALLDNNGNAFEGENNGSVARQKGEFCVEISNFADLINARTSAGIFPIHREDCNKPLSDTIRRIVPGPVTGEYMKCGITGWNCNTLWSTSFPAALSSDIKLTYAIAGNPLKCGDPGFIGACATAYDPTTADCSKTNGNPGEGEKCQAIKTCIVDSLKSENNCTAGWTACVTSYPSDNINYNICKAFISKGDFEGGKYVQPVPDKAKTSSCSVEGIGWIVCPLANAVASMADMAFGIVSAFMRVEPLSLDTSGSNPLYNAWSIMRNFANAAFVIAFLIIIYSQITSMGISNYGVKKLLPRLVVTAILVNLSYFICAIAVDLSNVLGTSLQAIFNTIRGQITQGAATIEMATWSNITSAVLGGGTLIAGGVVFTALSSTTVWAALVGLLPLVISALFALVIAFLILLVRQALIVILIVIAPLAFVAYLLPNTESLFTKWKSLFTTLLLLFPVLSLIFGGSQLAADILRASAESTMKSNDAGIAMTGFFMYIGAVAIQVIPFFITPLLMKVSSGVLARVGGMINQPNKGPIDGAKKWAEGKAKNASNKGYINKLVSNNRRVSYGARRRARRNAIGASLEQESKRTETSYVATAAQDATTGEAFRQRMAGSTNPESMQRVLANAINVEEKLQIDEVNAASAVIKNLDKAALSTLSLGGSTHGLDASNSLALKTAAMQKVINTQDVDGTNKLLDLSASGGMNTETRQAFAEILSASSARPAYINQGAIADIRQGGAGLSGTSGTQLSINAINNNTYSTEKMATLSKDELDHIYNVASNPVNATNNVNIKANATIALSDVRYSGQINKQIDAVNRLKELEVADS